MGLEPRILTGQEIEDIADKAAEKALTTFATKMGMDVKNPLDMQSDMLFIRKMRSTCESIGTKIMMIVVGVLTFGALGGIGLAIKKWAVGP